MTGHDRQHIPKHPVVRLTDIAAQNRVGVQDAKRVLRKIERKVQAGPRIHIGQLGKNLLVFLDDLVALLLELVNHFVKLLNHIRLALDGVFKGREHSIVNRARLIYDVPHEPIATVIFLSGLVINKTLVRFFGPGQSTQKTHLCISPRRIRNEM